MPRIQNPQREGRPHLFAARDRRWPASEVNYKISTHECSRWPPGSAFHGTWRAYRGTVKFGINLAVTRRRFGDSPVKYRDYGISTYEYSRRPPGPASHDTWRARRGTAMIEISAVIRQTKAAMESALTSPADGHRALQNPAPTRRTCRARSCSRRLARGCGQQIISGYRR